MLSRNVERFREALVFKAHRLMYHSTLGLRVIKKKTELSVNVDRDLDVQRAEQLVGPLDLS